MLGMNNLTFKFIQGHEQELNPNACWWALGIAEMD